MDMEKTQKQITIQTGLPSIQTTTTTAIAITIMMKMEITIKCINSRFRRRVMATMADHKAVGIKETQIEKIQKNGQIRLRVNTIINNETLFFYLKNSDPNLQIVSIEAV